jgi:hypothetical protein
VRRGIVLIASACALSAVAAARPVSAQTYRGTGSCVKSGCHAKEKTWHENEDGPPPNQHRAAYLQLTRDMVKSTKYAASIGLANPQDPAGRCVECHAPPLRARFADGVSCEVCHGPGSSYYDPHDDEPYKTVGYQKALGLGMQPLLENPAAWIQRCVTCHVVRESKLIDAGHPSGDDFDLAIKYRIVASPNGNHWKTNYSARSDEIGRLAKQFGDPIRLARSKSIPTASVTPPPVPPPPPATTTIASPASAPPMPSMTTVPGGLSSAGATTTVTPPSGAAPMVARGKMRELMPSPPPPMAPPPPPPTMTVPGPPVVVGLPRSPAALVAAVQGRVIELLNSLLLRGGVAPVRVRPESQMIPYDGPDAELLRLQREALMLAIEALGRAPNPPPPPKPQGP